MEFFGPNMHFIFMTLSFLALLIFVAALIHLIMNKSKPALDKLFWLIIILVVPVLGPILYFILGRRN